MHSIWDEFSKLVFRAEIQVQPEEAGGAVAATEGAGAANLNYSGGTMENQPSALQQVAATGGAAAAGVAAPQADGNGNGEVVETVVKDEKENIGRNDPCWCGSGKKYKKCHGA
ncbi:MAG TPA: SEC-C metal-binding domain-containing protein, partial [Solirubrobacterales bacterium]|nr:SEC-C metal-binding domain-containing protein [Solirubrobacterales bacterium]